MPVSQNTKFRMSALLLEYASILDALNENHNSPIIGDVAVALQRLISSTDEVAVFSTRIFEKLLNDRAEKRPSQAMNPRKPPPSTKPCDTAFHALPRVFFEKLLDFFPRSSELDTPAEACIVRCRLCRLSKSIRTEVQTLPCYS